VTTTTIGKIDHFSKSIFYGSSLFHAGKSKIRFTGHDVDYGNEVFNRTISFCFSSGRLDQAIDPFQNAIVDACLVKLNDAIPMSFDRIGGLFYRLQAGMGSPEIPFLKK